MTRKDYVAIAAAIKSGQPAEVPGMPEGWINGATAACEQISYAVAEVMAKDNPRFDTARFLAAGNA